LKSQWLISLLEDLVSLGIANENCKKSLFKFPFARRRRRRRFLLIFGVRATDGQPHVFVEPSIEIRHFASQRTKRHFRRAHVRHEQTTAGRALNRCRIAHDFSWKG
jgi:hypothetical protein